MAGCCHSWGDPMSCYNAEHPGLCQVKCCIHCGIESHT